MLAQSRYSDEFFLKANKDSVCLKMFSETQTLCSKRKTKESWLCSSGLSVKNSSPSQASWGQQCPRTEDPDWCRTGAGYFRISGEGSRTTRKAGFGFQERQPLRPLSPPSRTSQLQPSPKLLGKRGKRLLFSGWPLGGANVTAAVTALPELPNCILSP